MIAVFKCLLVLLISILSILNLKAQSVSSILVDANTKAPIAYASVVLKNKQGVISNEEGSFTLQLEGLIKATDSLFISCMGYENVRFSLSEVRDSIFIQGREIILNEVIVSNKNFTAEEIVEKVKAAMTKNHPQLLSDKKMFFRTSETQNINKMDVDFKKSSIEELNKKLVDSVMGQIPKKGFFYTEILANITGDYSPKNQKINIIKASKLYDKNNSVNIEGLEKKFNKILQENIKKDSYLKIKSGWISGKVTPDNLFTEKKEIDSSNTAALDSLATAKKKSELEEKTNFANYRKRRVGSLFGRLFFNKDSPFDFFFKDGRYKISLEDFTYMGNIPVYKLRFLSKGRSDYNAVIYINADDFAVVRMDFKNAGPLKKMNLLGFSYLEYLNEGKAFFVKTEGLGYTLSYLEENSAEKVGIKRPLKIVEKNKFAKGRRKQNELLVEIEFEINSQNKNELVVFSQSPITPEDFKKLKENNQILPTYLPVYDPAFWEGYNIIEPNKAIKNFSAIGYENLVPNKAENSKTDIKINKEKSPSLKQKKGKKRSLKS
jgi:hypothetical protein